MAKKSNYDSPYTQRSENNSGHSGLSAEIGRHTARISNAVTPTVKEDVKPVNPKV